MTKRNCATTITRTLGTVYFESCVHYEGKEDSVCTWVRPLPSIGLREMPFVDGALTYRGRKKALFVCDRDQ